MLLFLLAGGCKQDDSGMPSRAQCLVGTYTGTSKVKLRYYNPNGSLHSTKTFQYPCKVFVDKPAKLKNASLEENNPFNFSIYADNQVGEGAFSVVSGMGFTDPNDGKEVLNQYWNLDWNVSGETLNGNLTNTHISSSLALNLINVRDFFINFVLANAMNTQTTLSGTINCNQISVEVKGRTTNEAVRFDINVSASK